MRRHIYLSLVCLFSLLPAGFAGEEKILVTFNREVREKEASHPDQIGKPRGSPPWDTAEYGIQRRNYGKSTLDSDFVDTLGRARMLVIARDASEEAGHLFGSAKYQAAIRSLLSNGGVLVFQYHGLPTDSKTREYFKSIGVDHPGTTKGKYYSVEIPSAVTHPITRSPRKLARSERSKSAYGWWEAWSAKQTALFTPLGNPDKAALLLQEGVQGNGSVIFSRIFAMGRSNMIGQNPFYRGLLENLLTHAYGPLTKGEVISLDDARGAGSARSGNPPRKVPKARTANPLYFRKLLEKPWWDSRWPFRVPFLVFEPVGIERHRAPVSVIHEFPAGTDPSSIRVVTPWGEEIPSQAHRVGASGSRIEVVFVHDLLPHEHVPMFIYFGSRGAAAARYETDLQLKQDDRHFAIWNERVSVKMRRRHPLVTHLQPRGNPTGNQLRNHSGLFLEGSANAFHGTGTSFSSVNVVENGPVRIVIQYKGEIAGKPGSVTYSLYSGSGRVNYEFQTEGNARIRRRMGWLPGKGLEKPDRVYFATEAGLKGLKITDPGPFNDNLTEGMTEGWYAFQDTETGEAVGELFELARNRTISVYIHLCMGYLCTISSSLSSAPLRGALVPSPGPFVGVRDEYVLWKNPPEVLTAEAQRMTQILPKVPVFGRDFIQTESLSYHWHIAVGNSNPSPPASIIPDLTRALQRLGSNYVAMTCYQPFWKSKWMQGARAEFMGELLKHAHANGMGVMTWLNSAGSGRFHNDKGLRGDKITLRKYYVDAAREIGLYDVDILLLLDEDGFYMGSAAAKDLFRKKYGLEPPGKSTVERLADPANYSRVFFEMDVYTDCIRDMAKAVRENNPRMIVSDQVNPSHLTKCFGGYHDYEEHATFLSTICMDLYGGARREHEYYVKYMKGAFGNNTPILLYTGCTSNSGQSRRNHYGLLMWGPDLFFHWSPGQVYETVTRDTLKKVRYHLDYTGLGDLVTRAVPARSIAVLRDRDGFDASVKRGEWGTYGATYEARIQQVIYVKNLLSDIVFSRHLTPAELRKYDLLVLVNNPAFSDRTARIIETYLKGGGKVFMEGEGINNGTLARLVGVRSQGKKSARRGDVKMGAHGFSFYGDAVAVSRGGRAIAEFEDGAPAFFSARVGSGEIVYTPLVVSDRVSQQDDLAGFFRALVKRLAGPQPLEVAEEHANAVDTNLMRDGRTYVLAVRSDTYKAHDVAMTFNVGIPRDSVIVNMHTGEESAYSPTTTFRVEPGALDFYFIGPKSSVALPAISKSTPARAGLAYSPVPEKLRLMRLSPERRGERAGKSGKRDKTPGVTYVGVLTDRDNESPNRRARVRGDEGIYHTLQGKRKLTVEYVHGLEPEALDFYDVIVIPNIGSGQCPPVLHKGWENDLRRYVERGGAALLCHHAVGYQSTCAFPPFPEVGKSGGYAAIREMLVVKDHPVTSGAAYGERLKRYAQDPAFQEQFDAVRMKEGDTFRCGFPDYIQIVPGSAGTILVRSARERGIGGDPAVVAGRLGKGRVVLSGIAIGSKGNAEEGVTKGGEENILVNAVYWLSAE